MDIVKSVFSSDSKCDKCGHKFKLTSKRRQCAICSEFYTEGIFCKSCSVKEPHPHFGFLKAKRYCKTCHSTLQIPAHVSAPREESKTPEVVSEPRSQPSAPAAVTHEVANVMRSFGISAEDIAQYPNEVMGAFNTMKGLAPMPSKKAVDTR